MRLRFSTESLCGIQRCADLLAAEARERGLVAGVDGCAALLGTGSATGAATELAAGGAIATATTTATATGSTIATGTATTAATGTAAGGALGLDVAVLDLNELLDLALTLALGLATASSKVILTLFLDEGLGAGPLLVVLHSLVGLAEGKSGLALERELLLGQLGEVLVEGDVLVLFLLFLPDIDGSSLTLSLLLLGLGNLLAGLLVLKLSIAFGGAPSLSSLLLSTASGC